MQIFPHRDIDTWGRVWMSCFRKVWKILNFYKEYLFGFETLIFATLQILSVHYKDKGKLEIASYDLFKNRIKTVILNCYIFYDVFTV